MYTRFAPHTSARRLAGWRGMCALLHSLCLLMLTLLAAAPAARAQANGAADATAWTEQASLWINERLKHSASDEDGPSLRPELVWGQLDSRLRLAPCSRVEPYLPAGTQLWGRSRIGLRCVEGPVRWNVFVPLTVKVWGPAWLVQRTLPPGHTLSAADAVLGEVDWAQSPVPVVARQADWVGTVSARALAPGQALRQNMLNPVRVFDSGTEVKVVVRQNQIQLTATGRAMSHGFLGETVKVKLPSGRTVSGRVRKDATVAVKL